MSRVPGASATYMSRSQKKNDIPKKHEKILYAYGVPLSLNLILYYFKCFEIRTNAKINRGKSKFLFARFCRHPT